MKMSFHKIGRSVACALFMAVLVNSQISPKPAAVRNECPAKSIESRLEDIEGRLEGLEKTVSTLNSPLIKEGCAVYLASLGYDDSLPVAYVKTSSASSDLVLNFNVQNRGVTLLELDVTACTTKNRQTVDTYASANDRLQLLESLESASAGTIIVGVTVDTPENGGDFQNIVGSFFTRYNMNLTGLQMRDKFAFIMQKGYPKKTVFERKPRYGESLKMTIVPVGSTANDVTFSRV